MGRTFANIQIFDNDQQGVAASFARLPRRPAVFVSPPEGGWISVCDEASDEPDEDRLSGYTVMLSKRRRTSAIGFLVYESDVLLYTLADCGRLVDHYSSWPDYFDETAEVEGLEGDEKALAALLPKAVPAAVRAILTREYDFAEEKLAALLPLLGLPARAALWGYNDLVDAVESDPGALPDDWPAWIALPAASPTL